jgi:hypothetical protein
MSPSPSLLRFQRAELIRSNDALKLRAISMGPALSHAQTVLKANKRMGWSMAMKGSAGKILWARIAQVHEDTEVAQVAVRFDSDQVRLPFDLGA